MGEGQSANVGQIQSCISRSGRFAGFGIRSYLELVLAALSLRGGVEKIDSENLAGHVSGHV
jgi:hypothetical protein